MDPLSDVLSLIKVQTYWSAGFDFGGAWALGFGPYEGIKFYAAISGSCWLQFALAGEAASLLLGVLPPIVHIRNEADKAVLHWCLERMRQELRDPQPGGFVVAQQLATLLLVQTLRLHLAEGRNGGVGWLLALADKKMAAAISAMHEEPAAAWTVQSLAARAGMSRTTFALKFKATVGASPLKYLTRWRMTVAGDRLVCSSDPISEIAQSLGYDSLSAFSLAFKRVMGCSPRQYGRGGSLGRGEAMTTKAY